MRIYLNSYRPLIHRVAGRAAVRNYAIPPFVDASCRREPDLEAEFPSITALCRFRHFAPRLREEDIAVYLTVKRRYPGCSEPHWRLAAILQVVKRFETHADAAEWCGEQGVRLPSNCMIEGNAPVPLDRTDGSHRSLEAWDRMYRRKAAFCPVFLACRPLFRDLHDPPVVTEATMISSFGHVPGTRTPPVVSLESVERLIAAIGLDIRLLERA